MNRKWLRFLAVPALAGGMLFAQTPGTANPAEGQSSAKQGRNGKGGHGLAQSLNLTDAQKEQVKSIMSEAKQSSESVRGQLKTQRQALQAAIKANNTAQIQQISATEGSLMGQLTAIRSSAWAKVYHNVLTAEQRATADQLPSHFRQMRQHHGEKSRSNS